MTKFGRSLELYFIDGRPDGMLTAEVFNWTGHVLKAPRNQIQQALGRPEAAYTGVYLLLGERDGASLAYIGEGEDVAARIRDHDSKKDWWTDLVIITTAANNLHKAHVKFLESRLVEQARNTAATALENGNTPPRPGLSEAAKANMEEFLDTLLIVLPAIGIDIFVNRKRPTSVQNALQGNAQRFVLETRKNNVKATAVLEDGEFIVLKGSRVRARWAGAGDHDSGYRGLHSKLVASGVIAVEDGEGVFTENYAFNSPSAAAAVANGRPANGRIEWKVAGGHRTYHDWEVDQLNKALP